MAYDGGALYVKVEIYINGAFVEVTSRARGGRAASGVEISRGRGTSALQAETSQCQLTLGNEDAYATEGNPESPWYPYFGRGCRIRVSISGVAVSDVVRFDGEIDTIVAVYPGGADSSVRITATGVLGGTLGLGSDPLRSPLFRSISGVAADDYEPHAYWPGEDRSSATRFASGLPGGTAATFGGSVSLASNNDGLAGSEALPIFSAGSTAVFPIATYTDTGQWLLTFVMRITDIPASNTDYIEIRTTGSTVTRWVVRMEASSGGQVVFLGYNSTGSVLATGIPLIVDFDLGGNQGLFEGKWFLYSLAVTDIGGGQSSLAYGAASSAGLEFSSTDTETITPGIPTLIRVLAPAEMGVGHVAVFVDPAMDPLTDLQANVGALSGWTSETPDARIERLCREEGIAVTVTGTSDQAMGPQELTTLANLLTECEAVDGGLLSDGGDGGGLTYRCLSSIYNQTASLAVTQGSLDVDVAPIWDNRNIRNDVTASRPEGSSARVTDEAHIARTRRRIKDSVSTNVETDAQLPDQAGWRVNTGTSAAPRYNGVGINLRNSDGRHLAEAVLALAAGDRFTAAEAALPSQHPPGGIDSLVVGWSEQLDKDEWLFAPNCVDYAPYRVIELDDDNFGKLDTDGTELVSGVTSSATSLRVLTTTPGSPLWTTDAGEMPVPLVVAGEVMSATAIASLAVDPFTRSTSNSWGSTPEGFTYTHDGTASAFNTTGTTATHTHTAANTGRLSRVDIGCPDARIRAVHSVPALASGVALVAYNVARFVDANNYYMARIGWTTGATITLTLRKRVAGVETNLLSVTIPALTHVAATRYVVDFECIGTSLSAKLWPESGTEPRSWQANTTDTDLTAGNWVGLRSVLDTGSTNVTPFLFTFDAFTVLNPQTMTVTRSVNSVAKAQSAGAAVNVHQPARLAL